ncbi:MAG TPA: UDP-2,4-diacetamido-2,4,6-trideoxy-beta-L-altropyranose hydrolase, partial [Hyphomicrobiaceae bacterium]
DLAIGAAGSTSWERCALGLPTLVVVLAMNQYEVAMNLEKSGAATIVSLHEPGKGIKAALLGMSGALLEAQSHNAALLVDGNGTQRVVEVLNDRGGL